MQNREVRLSGKISSIFDHTITVGGTLAGVLLVVLMLVVSVKVVFRYVLHEGLVGIDQISGMSLLYITFLGAAWVLKRGGHVTIDILSVRLNPETQRWLSIITSIVGAVVCLILTWYGTMEALNSWQKGIMTAKELEIPRAISTAIIPVGSFFLSIQFLRRAWSYHRGKEVGEKAIIV